MSIRSFSHLLHRYLPDIQNRWSVGWALSVEWASRNEHRGGCHPHAINVLPMFDGLQTCFLSETVSIRLRTHQHVYQVLRK